MIVDPNDAHLIQLINPPINGLHVRVWGERERERERERDVMGPMYMKTKDRLGN